MRFASFSKTVTVKLDFKDPVRRIECLALSAIIGGTKSGKVFLGMPTSDCKFLAMKGSL
jgi:hypothetical protein